MLRDDVTRSGDLQRAIMDPVCSAGIVILGQALSGTHGGRWTVSGRQIGRRAQQRRVDDPGACSLDC